MPVTLYAHLTWTTHRRAELIDRNGAAFLGQVMPKLAKRFGSDVLEVGVVRNHVHLLLVLPPIVDIPRLVQGLKGSSARIANRDRILGSTKLRWAPGYDLRSVSPRNLAAAQRYVRDQSRRHPSLAVRRPERLRVGVAG